MNYFMLDGKKTEMSEETANSLRCVSRYSGGDGSKENPYQISNLKDLEYLSVTKKDWSSCFIQISNIDAKETKEWNLGKGFSPIGNTITPFTGEYDGQGHTINSLYISRPSTNYIGLFGYTSGTVIDSIGLMNIDITGDRYVGGLVGENHSSIVSNSHSTGNVNGDEYVGGLVGYSYYYSIVTNSYSTGNVSGNNFVSGFVGYNRTSSTVSNSYSTGSVSGNNYVSGLVGYNVSSIVTNSYSTGSVIGGTFVGGLVGENDESTVSNSYSTGNVNGSDTDVGGLVGNNYNSTINNSYSTGKVF